MQKKEKKNSQSSAAVDEKKMEGKSDSGKNNPKLPLKTQNNNNNNNTTGPAKGGSNQPTNNDSVDDGDESVTLSVDDVDVKDVKNKSKKEKKSTKRRGSPLKKGSIGNSLGGAYLELANEYHGVFEREGRHHKGISTLCCQCFCYICFLSIYLMTIFLSNESSKSFFFQQHIRETFNLNPTGSCRNSLNSGNLNFGHDGTIENVGAYVSNYILQNPKIVYKKSVSETSPITGTLLPDGMISILGKVLVREYDVENNKQSLSNDYSVCQFEELKAHYAEQCATFVKETTIEKKSTEGIKSIISTSVGTYGYSGDWYEGSNANKNTLLSLDYSNKMTQWNNEVFPGFSNQTKFILFEMNFFSGHTLQFGSLRLGFEKSSSGNILSTQSFAAENLYNFRNPLLLLSSNILSLQAQMRIVESILVVLSSIYLLPAVINWLTYGTANYLSKIWNILPLINCALFITILIFKIMIGDRIELILKRVRFDSGMTTTFEDIYTVIYLIKFMKAINGINAIVLILNIFRYFEANKKLAIFISGVQHALWDMILFLPTVLGFTVLAYAVAFHLFFGDRITNFKNISSSVYSLVTLLVGNSDGFIEIYDESWQIGISLYISYIAIVVIILGTTFFSVVDAAYHHAKGKKEFGSDIDFLSEDFADTFYILTVCCTCPCRKLENCCQASVGKKLRQIRKIKSLNNQSNPTATGGKTGAKKENVNSISTKGKINNISKLSKISQVMPFKRRYNINPKKSGMAGGNAQMEVLLGRIMHENEVQNKRLLHEIHELFEHYVSGLELHSDGGSTLGSSDYSEDDIDDYEDEFKGDQLKSDGHAGRRKELKRHRAGESETKRGPHKKVVHPHDNEYEDYDIITHDDEHV